MFPPNNGLSPALRPAQWIMLALLSVLLLIELSLANQLILQQITGDSYTLTSIGIAAIIVVEARRHVQAWIWGSAPSR